MKLGIAYNVFDGVELLPFSIKAITPMVDYICLVVQNVSNFGEKTEVDFNQFKDVVNEIHNYHPVLDRLPAFNEQLKRNIGLTMCKNAGCTHFISADVDEFYLENELYHVKQIIEDENYDSSACQMVTYYKTPEYRLEPMETYFIPLIIKLDERIFGNYEFPVFVDPTRRIPTKNIRIFERNIIQMHHYSYVREDLRSKLKNSSAKELFAGNIDNLIAIHQQWQPGDKAIIAPWHQYDTVKVDNIFNINI